MEWEAAALVLSARGYGESDALIRLFSEDQGVTAGLARGGASRRRAALWQPGNLVVAHWRARLPEQLGTVTAEAVQEAGVRLLDRPEALLLLLSVMAVADGALPEHEPHPDIFADLVRLVTAIAVMPDEPPFAMAVRWEASLLRALGYGLRLERCAVTGVTEGLAYVSPRSGRAVAREAAGIWAEKLLPLPLFLSGDEDNGTLQGWLAGLKMTGYFLGKHVFGVRHRPLPEARQRLVAMLTDKAATEEA